MIALVVFILAFFITRCYRGKEYANDWLYDALVGTASVGLVLAIVFAFKAIFCVPIQLIKLDETSLKISSETVNSFSNKVNGLTKENLGLSKQHDRDQSALEAVAAVTGATNGSFIENAELLSDKINEIRSDLAKIANRVLAPMVRDTIAFTDTNRVTVLKRTNHGPTVFFKLRDTPIAGTINVTIQSTEGQEPGMIGGEYQNIVWMIFPNSVDLNPFTFIFDYLTDTNSTKTVHNVWTNSNEIVFDRTLMTNVDSY